MPGVSTTTYTTRLSTRLACLSTSITHTVHAIRLRARTFAFSPKSDSGPPVIAHNSPHSLGTKVQGSLDTGVRGRHSHVFSIRDLQSRYPRCVQIFTAFPCPDACFFALMTALPLLNGPGNSLLSTRRKFPDTSKSAMWILDRQSLCHIRLAMSLWSTFEDGADEILATARSHGRSISRW